MEENMTLILGLYAAGLAVSGLLFAYRLGKAGEKRLCALIGMILGLPLAYAGAKLFFLLHNAGLDLRNWSAETMFLPRWEELSFAGGCLGFVLGIRVAAGILRVPGGKALDLFAVPGCILIIFFTWLHMCHKHAGAKWQDFITAFKIVPFLILAVVGLFFIKGANMGASIEGSAGATGAIGAALMGGVAATTWSYDGMQTCVTMGGEIKDPKKNMPIALIGTVLVCTLLYVLLVTAAVGMTDVNVLAGADAPIATAFEAIMGKTSGTVAALLAVVVVTGSLSSLIMFQARGEMKAAQEGYWWRSWGKIDPKYDSPVVSMLWQSGFALILVWLSTIQDLLGIFTFICLVRNALLFVAWFPLQKKENYKPSFRAPGGAIMAILAIVPSAILAWGELGGIVSGEVPLLSWNPISAGLLVIASALPFYFYFRKVNADIIEEAERRRNEAILGTSD